MKSLMFVYLIVFVVCGCSTPKTIKCTKATCMHKSQQLLSKHQLKKGLKYARQACVLDEGQCSQYYKLVSTHGGSTKRQARADICLHAHAAQCHEAGRQYALEAPINYPTAYRLFVHGCQRAHAASCYGAGVMHQNKFIKHASYKEERRFYNIACKTWYPNACFNLAVNYIRSEDKEDVSKGIALYDKLCKKGRYLGCVELGTRYIEGWGVKKDYVRGLLYLKKACFAKVAGGCRRYADRLFERAKTDDQKIKAIDTYLLSCQYGSPHGCLRAANSAEKFGMVLDKKQIDDFRQRALEAFVDDCDVRRSGFSCWRVGEIYYRGWRSPKSKAPTYFKKACTLDKRTCSWDKDYKGYGI